MGWEPWRKKSTNLLVKLLVSVLLVAISFRLFFSRSDTFLPTPLLVATTSTPDAPSISEPSPSPSPSPPPPDVLDDAKDEILQTDPPLADNSSDVGVSNTSVPLDIDGSYPQREKCDLFTGEWIHNPSGPSYTNASCSFIETPQNCMENGRPDTGYLYWRWKPHDCDVAAFDAEKFLDVMQNKSWALIGDSIFRNHAQSLLCLLSKVEEPVEVYHDETYKSRRWRFNSHNFTLSLIWAPFIVKANIFENSEGLSNSELEVHLDTLDSKLTSQYPSFDYVLISGGQWFLKTAVYLEEKKAVGCHYCPGRNLTELGLEYAYHKALELLFKFVSTSDHKPLVIYRTWTPDHFENGEWFSGGTCNRTEPYKEGEYDGKDVDHLMRSIELEEFSKVVVNGTGNGTHLKLLDTFHLSVLRPDGHSGPYRNFHPFDNIKSGTRVQNDCLHWCLPGPIDSWNDLLMEMAVNE